MTTLPPITKRQQDILNLIYEYRFLTRTQIQLLLGHKQKSKTNKWLKDLRTKQYLEAIYSQKRETINDPAIYYASLGAIRYFKTLEGTHPKIIQAIYRDNTRSKGYIDSRILLADMAIQLQPETPGTRYVFATRARYSRPVSRGHWLVASPISPDAVVIKIAGDEYSNAVVQIFPAKVPVYAIYKTISDYMDVYFESTWEEEMAIDFPTVILVFGAKWAQDDAIQYIYRHRRDTKDIPFQCLTVSKLKAQGLQKYL